MRNIASSCGAVITALAYATSSVDASKVFDESSNSNLQHTSQQTRAADWEQLRIEWMPGSLSEISARDQSFLMDELMPQAVLWLKNALFVKPWSGNLRAARSCHSRFTSTGSCAGGPAQPACGIASDGGILSLPNDLLDSLEICESCTRRGSCSGCSTTPAGEGAEADFVLVVSAVSTAACAAGTLAYAGTCQRDRLDRPTFGQVNFCPSALSLEPDEFEPQVVTAIHELVHALGFSHASWALW